MLSDATKEAIKVSLALSLALVLALLFSWAKPYWAAVTVVALAANETYGHSIKLARYRLLGTFMGACVALLLVGLFAQDSALFIGFFILYAGISTYLSFDAQYGYMFRIGFVVCALISCIGYFNDVTSFEIIIIRIQETVLGVVVFSLVFRLLWPVNTEAHFFVLIKRVSSTLLQVVTELNQNQFEANSLSEKQLNKLKQQLDGTWADIGKMQAILQLPLAGSYQLRNQLSGWKTATALCLETVETLKGIVAEIETAQQSELPLNGMIFEKILQTEQSALQLKQVLSSPDGISFHKHHQKQNTVKALAKVKTTWSETLAVFSPKIPVKAKANDALTVMLTIGSCMALWIFIPLPNGFMFPLLASILAINIITMPREMVNHALMGITVFGAIILAEYIFIMPKMTEVWQLALFYFINLFAIWRVCSTPKLAIQKVVGGNLLVVLTMTALYLTPSYNIEVSLNLLIEVYLAMGVVRFFIVLCKPEQVKAV